MDDIEDGLRQSVEEYIQEANRPMIFDPHNSDNVILIREKQFEDTCSMLEENGTQNPKKLTEFEFLGKMLFLKRKHESLAKHGTTK